MARVPKNVIAVTPGGDITKDMILGFYALFYIPDQPISASKLRKLWLAEGLDENLVPRNRRAVNAFQVACRSVETRRHSNGSNVQAEVKVDEVDETSEYCIYQITRMVRDRDNRVIDHPKAMRVTFDKGTEAIKFENLDRSTAQALGTLKDDITEHFEKNAKKLPGSKVRAAIRAILDKMGATNVRRKSGGVYFCPKEGHGTLESLQAVLDGLYDGVAELHLIACANAEGERKMIEKHFTVNVKDEFNELMADVATRLREGTGIRADRLKNIVNRRREIEGHAERYRTLLDSNLGDVEESGRLLDEQIEELVTKLGADL